LFKDYLKKALFKSAFFVLAICVPNLVYAKNSCDLFSTTDTEKALVKWVYDGDTLLVTDESGSNKRKIRVIGIDTPEVKHHQQKAQLFGAKAREALRVLLKEVNYHVFLEFDKEKQDRYERLLAHVYLENGKNISEWLLQQGFARTLIIPPNIKHVECYKQAESEAQQQVLRLWGLKNNRIKKVQDLKSRTKGYIRLRAKVIRIKRKKKSLLLQLESSEKKPIQLKIRNRNLHYFKGINFDSLVYKEVIVSGVLKNRKGKRTITLNHPSQLDTVMMNNTDRNPQASMITWSK